eukprot:m.192944 g.192944  ORF g.192944 m.192944 type:complete len:89 (+) comp24962_c0_seq3:2201-2467(+)
MQSPDQEVNHSNQVIRVIRQTLHPLGRCMDRGGRDDPTRLEPATARFKSRQRERIRRTMSHIAIEFDRAFVSPVLAMLAVAHTCGARL